MKTHVERVFGEDDKHTCSVRPSSSCAPSAPRTGPPRARASSPFKSGDSFDSSCNKNVTQKRTQTRQAHDPHFCLSLAASYQERASNRCESHSPKKKSGTMRCVLSEFSQGKPVPGSSGSVKKPATVVLCMIKKLGLVLHCLVSPPSVSWTTSPDVCGSAQAKRTCLAPSAHKDKKRPSRCVLSKHQQ